MGIGRNGDFSQRLPADGRLSLEGATSFTRKGYSHTFLVKSVVANYDIVKATRFFIKRRQWVYAFLKWPMMVQSYLGGSLMRRQTFFAERNVVNMHVVADFVHNIISFVYLYSFRF